jgi:hypothetical protein
VRRARFLISPFLKGSSTRAKKFAGISRLQTSTETTPLRSLVSTVIVTPALADTHELRIELQFPLFDFRARAYNRRFPIIFGGLLWLCNARWLVFLIKAD